MYKFECNQWTKIVQPSAEMLETRNLRIIFCNVDIKYLTSVLFNMRFEKWYSKRYLIEKKFKFGLTKLNGWTYIIGGYKDYRTDCSVDCFSVNEMKKSRKAKSRSIQIWGSCFEWMYLRYRWIFWRHSIDIMRAILSN